MLTLRSLWRHEPFLHVCSRRRFWGYYGCCCAQSDMRDLFEVEKLNVLYRLDLILLSTSPSGGVYRRDGLSVCLQQFIRGGKHFGHFSIFRTRLRHCQRPALFFFSLSHIDLHKKFSRIFNIADDGWDIYNYGRGMLRIGTSNESKDCNEQLSIDTILVGF
jgi:hypothetical protein